MRRKMLWIVGLAAGACAISSTGVDVLAAPTVKTREPVHIMRTDEFGTLPESGVPVPGLKLYPVPSDKVYVVSNATNTIAGTNEKLIYSNPLANKVAEISAQSLVSDDIKLSVATGCALRRYTVQVIGKANPNACGGQGISCGPVKIDFDLYNECPGAGGTPIENTHGCVTNAPETYPECMVMPSEFDVTEIEFVPTQAVSLPSTLWLGIHASRASTGIIIGTPAQVGFSGDIYDTIDFPCNSSAGGFPSQPHASFNAQIWGATSCPDTCLTYQNIRSSQVGVNAGANNCIADDLELPRTCQLAEMEVGLRGAGIYDIELRRAGGNDQPEGGCVGGYTSMGGPAAIPGTHQRFLVPTGGLTVKRFTFDPPILLPSTNVFAVLVPNNINATWILTGRNAAIGDTRAAYYRWDTDQWAAVFPTGLQGGMQITLTCAGACPVGACCDQYVRDENNEAVCRNLPEINCPFPPKGSALKPPWAENVSCKVCNGGTRDGDACVSDADCAIASCDGGANNGLACDTGFDCSFCADGFTHCTTDTDCLGNGDGICRLAGCTAGTCVGNDPFLLPCGQAACCQPDGNCHNLTLNECNLLLPLSASRIWQVGQYCTIEGQRCPEPACIDATGDCQTANPRTCNGGPDDGNSCTFDTQCTSTDNGDCVDYPHAICQGGDHDTQECNNDLDCIPGGLCITSYCDGGARNGQSCEGQRDCQESYCEGEPGCNNPFCCTAVCRYAPGPPTDTEFCCEVHWDSLCASLAQTADLPDCNTAPGNDHCAPGRLTSGAQEILVDGLEGKTNTSKATVDSNDGFCCNSGIRRCDGGCQDPSAPLGKPCSTDTDCHGAVDGYCNFPDDFSTATCSAGCNVQEQCLISDSNTVLTYCVDGPNAGAPCKPRCVGGTMDGQPCGNVDQCPGGTACDGTVDCGEGYTCDNSFCEGADDGVCADAVPEPGGKGVASVWYYFTVPENGIDDTMNVTVSTCGSTAPATDSLLQVFSTQNPDAGKCDDNLGQCSDGSYCDRVLNDCGDGSTCAATSLACSISAQDCPIATSACELDLAADCSKLSSIACSDDAGDVACGQQGRGKLSKVCLPNLKRGETYFVLVSAKTTDVLGEYRVRVSSTSSCDQVLSGTCFNLICSGGPLDGEPCGSDADCTVPPTPDNDYCPNSIALPVAVGDTVVPFDLDGATFDCRDTPCNANLQNDIWYTWTAPQDQVGTGTLQIKTCGDGEGPPPDTELMIYHGCGCPAPTSPQPLCFSAGTDPTCLTSAQTNAPINVEAGDCLTIRLGDNHGFGGNGEMTVTYTYEPPPPCPSGSIFASAPANGAILAAWGLSNCDAAAGLTGVKQFEVFGPPGAANLECWSLCESTSTTPEGTVLPPNTVQSVEETSNGVYTVTLERPITPHACTSILYNEVSGTPSSTTYISLPGDADGSGVTTASDILEVIDAINGTPGPYDVPAGRSYSTDVDWNGATAPQDILTVVDLLNGAGDCIPWNGVAAPSCGSCPAP